MKLQGKHCKISDEKFLGYNGCKLNKQGYRKTQQLLGTSWLPGTHFGGGVAFPHHHHIFKPDLQADIIERRYLTL